MSRRGPCFNEEQKLAIPKEGEKNGVKAVRAKYDISTQSYRLWRYKAQEPSPKKYFPVENKRRILEEGCLKGIQQVCNAYRINPTTYYYWKRRLGFTKSPRSPGRRRKPLASEARQISPLSSHPVLC
jgi:transposase-like protein